MKAKPSKKKAPSKRTAKQFARRAGSAAFLFSTDMVQASSGLPGGGVVMVKMRTGKHISMTHVLDMREAARLAVALDLAIKTAMPLNDQALPQAGRKETL